VHGVLCGRSVQLKEAPSRFASPEALVAEWKARGYKLLLPRHLLTKARRNGRSTAAAAHGNNARARQKLS
jgi:hypothetical protein